MTATTLLGTATANASGAWTFVTVPLPDGVHQFHGDGYSLWHYQCGFGRDERHGRHGGAGGARSSRAT